MKNNKVICSIIIYELLAAIEKNPELANNYPISKNIERESFIFFFIKDIARSNHNLQMLDSKSKHYDDALTEELEGLFAGYYDVTSTQQYCLETTGLLLAIAIFTDISS
ncbi:MAG: hypothetical protein ACJAXJ_001761 [Colwellia sp.]|jgi:hypothetical protein